MSAMENTEEKAMKQAVKEYYKKLYLTENEQSPSESRIDVYRAIMLSLREGLVDPPRVLNVGSGPQLVERELIQTFVNGEDPRLLERTLFVTMDIAEMQKKRLKGAKYTNVV